MLQPTALTIQRLADALAPHGLRPPPIEPGPPWSSWAADLIDLTAALHPCRESRLLLQEAFELPSAAAAARRALLGAASAPGR